MILLSENFSPFLFRTKVPVLSYNMYIIPIHTLIICCVNCCNSHCKFKIQNENLKCSTLTPTLWRHFVSIEKSTMSLLCSALHYLNIVSKTNFQIFFFFWIKERNTTLFNISRVIFSHFTWIVWFHHELKVFKNRWIVSVFTDWILIQPNQQPTATRGRPRAVEIMVKFRFEPEIDLTWHVDRPKRDPLLSKLRNHCSHSTK